MDNIIVYVDDADYALHQLKPMQASAEAPQRATHWIVVACPPRMSRHISKWVNQSARKNWREKWSDKLFSALLPGIGGRGDRITTRIASGPLQNLTQTLVKEHGAARVLDARRPKFGHDLPPVSANQPATHEARWSVPGAVAGLGAFLVLASE
jgi:hypothetical protein